MNRSKLITAVALSAALATGAGCGAKGATTTVTAPAKTVTVTKQDDTKVAACQLALQTVLSSTKELLKGSTLYSQQIKPAYLAGVSGTSVNGITANIGEGTRHVNKATSYMKKARSFVTTCLG